MAVSSSALNIAQYAVMSNSPLVQAITYSLIDNGSVLQDIPFVNKKSLVANGVRWEGSLPTVNWRTLNAEPTVTSGTPKPYQEQAYILSNAIDTDRFLVEDENAIQDPRVAQVGAYLRSVSYDFNDKFVNNDPVAGDKNAPVGLRYRITNGGDYGVRSENLINGGGVDMTQGAMSTATINNFLELLDQALWSVASPDGNGVVLYMNEVMKRRLARGCRTLGTSGGFETTSDQFGRTVEKFRGAVIRDIGYKADQTTRVITNTETSAGAAGASTYTSIYAVHYGAEYLVGWQFAPLAASVQDVGLNGNAGTLYRTVIDWAVGLFPMSTRSMARLYGIKIS
jgi:hypothetical protein